MCKTYYQTTTAEMADIFHLYADKYIKKHPLPAHYLKIIHDITVCRSQYLGGHIYKCNHCGFETEVYNSCRNRHCPKCQFTARLKWVEKRKSEILPVGYFHNVFTLPHELNPLILRNKNVCLNLLFKAVAETLLQFAKNNIKGKIGFITLLHSWSQTLIDHFHLHCLIPSVAFSKNKDSIIDIGNSYLFKVENLSTVFRAKYIDYLKDAYDNNELKFPGIICEKDFKNLIKRLWNKQWVVYSKKPFAKSDTVLEYLSCYTHRVAIANHRIVSIDNGLITFKYKDRKNGNMDKEMTLSAEEFIRRFLPARPLAWLHVLPERFMKIRYFGFLANRNRKENIHLCRELLSVDDVETFEYNTPQLVAEVIGIDITICPQCKKGQMQTAGRILSDLVAWKTMKYNNSS